jgi:hypothetical protein
VRVGCSSFGAHFRPWSEARIILCAHATKLAAQKHSLRTQKPVGVNSESTLLLVGINNSFHLQLISLEFSIPRNHIDCKCFENTLRLIHLFNKQQAGLMSLFAL